MKRGDIYWANLDPTIGSEISKKRPVLIVSNDINNQLAGCVTVLPITSSFQKSYPFVVSIKKEDSGLQHDSTIKANQIRTLDKQRLVNKTCRLSELIMIEVEEAIRVHLDL